ncbi:hypothetical protein L1281_001055 [Neisseria sp. HSC-16F19]|nr:hypothetical protein [Neisseria sp. HSC-16F19]MCP2040472.1 hypothetical protein [Neisseria sp. HSC-16F19]
MMKQKLWLLLTAAVLGLAACGGQDQGSSAAPAEAAATAVDLTTAEGLQKAKDELQALPQFQGKSVQVFQDVTFHLGKYKSIQINLQNPDNPEHVDHYEYKDGAWSEPVPVQLRGNGDLKDNLTPLEEIDFALVADLNKIWLEKAQEVGVEDFDARAIRFDFDMTPRGPQRRWEAMLTTPRERYDLNFNLDGTVQEFKKQ